MVPRIERDWVHKSDEQNVFIGKPSRVEPNGFETWSEFPVLHPTYSDSPSGLSATGYLIEVARQANLALCHEFFAVPFDAGFLVANIDWQFTDPRPFVVERLAAFRVDTEVSETAERRGALTKIVTRNRFFDDRGNLFLSGGSVFLISSRKLTGRARSAEPLAAVTAVAAPVAQVFDPQNVLIGHPTRHEGSELESVPLVVDVTHPYFFEHENCHVPGMMLLEAGKQAAVAMALRRFPIIGDGYGDLYEGQIRFSRFADLNRPTSVVCRFGSLMESENGFRAKVELGFSQGDRPIGEISATIGFIAAEDAAAGSAIVRQQLEEALATANVDVPMNGAFQ